MHRLLMEYNIGAVTIDRRFEYLFNKMMDDSGYIMRKTKIRIPDHICTQNYYNQQCRIISNDQSLSDAGRIMCILTLTRLIIEVLLRDGYHDDVILIAFRFCNIITPIPIPKQQNNISNFVIITVILSTIIILIKLL